MPYQLVLQRQDKVGTERVDISDEMANDIKEKLRKDAKVIQVEDKEGNFQRIEVSHYSRISIEKVELYNSPGSVPSDAEEDMT
jgi:hypothetical protein